MVLPPPPCSSAETETWRQLCHVTPHVTRARCAPPFVTPGVVFLSAPQSSLGQCYIDGDFGRLFTALLVFACLHACFRGFENCNLLQIYGPRGPFWGVRNLSRWGRGGSRTWKVRNTALRVRAVKDSRLSYRTARYAWYATRGTKLSHSFLELANLGNTAMGASSAASRLQESGEARVHTELIYAAGLRFPQTCVVIVIR